MNILAHEQNAETHFFLQASLDRCASWGSSSSVFVLCTQRPEKFYEAFVATGAHIDHLRVAELGFIQPFKSLAGLTCFPIVLLDCLVYVAENWRYVFARLIVLPCEKRAKGAESFFWRPFLCDPCLAAPFYLPDKAGTIQLVL